MPRPRSAASLPATGVAVLSRLQARECGKQDQSEHHRQIFHDQPADGDAAALGLHQTPLLHRSKQHNGACHRQRQPEHQTGADGPAHRHRHAEPQQRRDRNLHDGAGHGDRLHRKQVFQGEMQADAEHQQYDTELRQFVGERLVGDEAGRKRSRGDTGEEISDQRLNTEPMGDRAEHKGEPKASDDGGDERRVMKHHASLHGLAADAPRRIEAANRQQLYASSGAWPVPRLTPSAAPASRRRASAPSQRLRANPAARRE